MYVHGSCVCVSSCGVRACMWKPDCGASEKQGSTSSLCWGAPPHSLRLQTCAALPGILHNFWGPISGPHAYTLALYQIRHPSPQPCICFSIVWGRFSPFSPKLAICPVSASHTLALQTCTITSFLYQGFVKFFPKRLWGGGKKGEAEL